MLVLFGKYRFSKKRTAYRNDFCLNCQGARIAEQYRTFDVGHLFFIPLLPLGHWFRWQCTTCGNDPHSRTRTSRTLKIVFAAVVGLFAALMWTPPLVPEAKDAPIIWPMRLLFPLAVAGIVLWIRKDRGDTGLQEGLQTVRPLEGRSCLYCNGTLDPNDYCATCDVRRLSLPPATAASQ